MYLNAGKIKLQDLQLHIIPQRQQLRLYLLIKGFLFLLGLRQIFRNRFILELAHLNRLFSLRMFAHRHGRVHQFQQEQVIVVASEKDFAP
jgi:hypothetical protein